MSEYSDIEFKLIKTIVICKNTGEFLVDLILDSEINTIMISSFVSALAMFGKENMGKIEEISVKGLEVEMIIVSKHDLILITLMDRDFYKDIIRERGEKILDLFHQMYKNNLDDCSDIEKFSDFRAVLTSELQTCLDQMKELEEKRDILRSGLEYKE